MSAFEEPRRLKYAGTSADDPLAAALTDFEHDGPSQAELRALEHRVQLTLALPVGALGVKGALGMKGALLAKLTSSLIAVPLAVGALAGLTIAGVSSLYSAPDPVHVAPTPTPVQQAIKPRKVAPPGPRPLLTAAPAIEPVKAPTEHAAPRPLPTANEQPAVPVVEAAETEVALLARAQAALASSPRTALDLVSVHARRFGAGALAQERETIAIAALLRLGRRNEAEARAEAFRSAFPTSAYTRRIDVLLQAQDR